MKENYTHVTILLDRSGSMESIREDIVGGFNRLLLEQKAVPGECTVTVIQFDSADPFEILRDFVPVLDVTPLGKEYKPRDCTPLYDAVGRAIRHTGEKLRVLPEHLRPGKVVFVTISDGLENASQEFCAAHVKAMTDHQEKMYGWQFVYLGANQDAQKEGAKMGTQSVRAATWLPTSGSAAVMYSAVSSNLKAYRSSNSTGMDFSPDQRVAMSDPAEIKAVTTYQVPEPPKERKTP